MQVERSEIPSPGAPKGERFQLLNFTALLSDPHIGGAT